MKCISCLKIHYIIVILLNYIYYLFIRISFLCCNFIMLLYFFIFSINYSLVAYHCIDFAVWLIIFVFMWYEMNLKPTELLLVIEEIDE